MMCKDLIDFNGKCPYGEEVIEYAVGQYMREANMTTHNFATPTLAELEERGYISEAIRKLRHISKRKGEPKKAPYPLYDDHEITKSGKVKVIPIGKDVAYYYRDLFIHRLGSASADLTAIRTACLTRLPENRIIHGLFKLISKEQMKDGNYKLIYETPFHDRNYRGCVILWLDENRREEDACKPKHPLPLTHYI